MSPDSLLYLLISGTERIMDNPLTLEYLRSLTDHELIDLLKSRHCEVFISRTGKFSLLVSSGEPVPPLPSQLIREAFRRRARLEPLARVNGIRLRGTGRLNAA
jgi:hypothetical protein